MADLSELKVQLTLSLDELQTLVALMNLAGATFPEGKEPTLIGELSTMYFQTMEQLSDGTFEDFEPE